MEPLFFPTGAEVYDALMAGIEPDLVSTTIPTLDEKYAEETEEQKKSRYERYSAAFAAYDEAYAKWEQEMRGIVKDYRKNALQSAEADSRSADETMLTTLESQFSSAA